MTAENTELWNAIGGLEIGSSESELTFADRLARENRWTPEFTQRVIAEYRKFLYLCAVAGHTVTPSDEVDQAWHLHLCYTRNYWDDCCKRVLGFPLHHGPTKGGKNEAAKFHELYEETLKSYRGHFGEEAPADVWPPSAIRFATRSFRRVDAARHFIIPKRAVAVFAAAIATVLFAAGCSSDDANSGAVGVFLVAAFLFVIFKAVKYGGGGKGGRGGGGGCGSGCGGGCSHGDSGCGSGCGGCGGD
ncbi:hypothetical protein VSU19_04605 [Verrucomicrobiales bacterium BCK34]|nr:hypothetical protein [Verrucomicrobiales bacterium BCK34]